MLIIVFFPTSNIKLVWKIYQARSLWPNILLKIFFSKKLLVNILTSFHKYNKYILLEIFFIKLLIWNVLFKILTQEFLCMVYYLPWNLSPTHHQVHGRFFWKGENRILWPRQQGGISEGFSWTVCHHTDYPDGHMK